MAFQPGVPHRTGDGRYGQWTEVAGRQPGTVGHGGRYYKWVPLPDPITRERAENMIPWDGQSSPPSSAPPAAAPPPSGGNNDDVLFGSGPPPPNTLPAPNLVGGAPQGGAQPRPPATAPVPPPPAGGTGSATPNSNAGNTPNTGVGAPTTGLPSWGMNPDPGYSPISRPGHPSGAQLGLPFPPQTSFGTGSAGGSFGSGPHGQGGMMGGGMFGNYTPPSTMLNQRGRPQFGGSLRMSLGAHGMGR